MASYSASSRNYANVQDFMCFMTYFNKTLGKYGKSIISVTIELAYQSTFHPTSLKLFLDFRSRRILSLYSLIEDTSQIPLLFQLKIEERPFPVILVFYMTISGDIATNRHKRNSLVVMHRWFCNRDSCGNTPAGVCQVS